MTQNGPGSPDPNDPWSSPPKESTLEQSSLDDSRQPGASPFSREGSGSDDALSTDPSKPTGSSAVSPPPSAAGAPQQPAWPSYPGTQPAPPSAPGQPHPYAEYGGAAYGSNPAPAPYQQPAEYGSNPYEVSPYQTNPYSTYGASSPYGVVPQNHPQGTLAMIMGILGLAVCPVFAIPGLILGNKVRKQVDAEPYRYTGRGMGTAGFVLGIIGLFYLAGLILLIILGLSGYLDS